MRLDTKDCVHRGQTYFMNREIFYSISKRHLSFHNKADVFYRFKVRGISGVHEPYVNY